MCIVFSTYACPFLNELIYDSTYTWAGGAPIVVGHCTHLKQNMQKSS